MMGRTANNGKYIRTTITVTTDLWLVMRKLKGVNWSAVANAAFRRYINGDVGLAAEGELIDLRHKLEELERKCGLR